MSNYNTDIEVIDNQTRSSSFGAVLNSAAAETAFHHPPYIWQGVARRDARP
jgi:hypothetical protein